MYAEFKTENDEGKLALSKILEFKFLSNLAIIEKEPHSKKRKKLK